MRSLTLPTSAAPPGANSGDAYIPNALSITPEPARGQAVTAATVRDSKTGDLILKLTNASASPMQLIISLQGAPATLNATATKTLLTGAPTAQNNQASPRTIMPQTSTLTVSAAFPCDLPANSFTVIRLKTK